jgi:hypothetical protein
MTEGGRVVKRALAHRRELLGAVASIVLLVVAAALAVWGGGSGEPDIPSPPRIASVGDVEELAAALEHPIYWAGEREGEELELKAEADGSVYLRYLPEGTEAGDPQQVFLTVGTYPVAGAQAALRRTAAEGGARLGRLDDGAVVLSNPASQGSVYLAHPDSDLQIEVYDPDPGAAMELIRSGAIEPVGD